MFRVKAAPSAPLTEVAMERMMMNGNTFTRFSTHNCEVLLRYMTHFYPKYVEAIRTHSADAKDAQAKQAPQAVSNTAAIGVNKLLLGTQNDQYFVSEYYVQNVLNSRVRSDAPPACSLPLPVAMFQALSPGEQLQARQFYHISEVEGYESYISADYRKPSATTEPAVLKRPTEYSTAAFNVMHPRDALTGMYFQREELIDNLLMAARVFNYASNPFWIRSDHPQLGKYLKLAAGGAKTAAPSGMDAIVDSGNLFSDDPALAGKGDAAPSTATGITLSLSSVVYFLEDVQPFIATTLLHPSLVPDVSSLSVAGAQKRQSSYDLSKIATPGMNAMTGFVSPNPYFSRPSSASSSGATGSVAPPPSCAKSNGCWLSLEQIRRYKLQLRSGAVPRAIISPTYFGGAPPAAPAVAAAPAQDDVKPKKGKKPTKGKKTTAVEDAAKAVSARDAPIVHWSEGGELVEVEEWEMFNAAQLAVPGRVALKPAATDESKPTGGLFD